MQQPLKIIFAGTPEIAASTLDKILASGFTVDLVLTQADRPAGRGKKLSMSPVKQLALSHKLEVFQPLSLKQNPAAIDKIRCMQADIIVVVAYGLILPPELLEIPPLGCINVHVSLLPHWRGAAPIQRAIIAGERYSGVTIMQMDAGLDTGAILLQQEIPVSPSETTGSLQAKLAQLGANMLVEYLKNYKQIKPIAQDNTGATYAHKINKSEAMLDFNENALTIDRKIRGFNPVPGAFTYLDGERLLIWQAEQILNQEVPSLPTTTTLTTTNGQIIGYAHDGGILVACGYNSVIKVTQLQLAGRKAQSAKQFSLGYTNLIGKILGAEVGHRYEAQRS